MKHLENLGKLLYSFPKTLSIYPGNWIILEMVQGEEFLGDDLKHLSIIERRFLNMNQNL